ncbi:ribosomal protein S6 kinase alpha-5 [Folsomia candida]|uniref:ribosomal protein S6 kinase alpha-5 n=1 Tax=Folsomia candida TaxID=158441 RepID=UPI0016051262|nr:ribosomal protein S6 kinase alpha-5 [Folsomia candida]
MATAKNSRLLEENSITKLLGAGSFGAVLQVVNRLDKSTYAIKVTLASDGDAEREVQNLVKVPYHKNLVRYHTCWKDSLSAAALKAVHAKIGQNSSGVQFTVPPGKSALDIICIQMELCGRDLRSCLASSRLPDDQKAMNTFIQLVKGVEHIHKYGIIHRDLKPENIFTSFSDPKIIKIGDLGIATSHSTSFSLTHTQATGTRLYFAPEQEGQRYGKSVDIYALGIIFLELLHPSAQPSHNNGSFDKLINLVMELKFKRQLPSLVGSKWPVAAGVILSMTEVDSDRRSTPSEIYSAFLEAPPDSSAKPKSSDSSNSSVQSYTVHYGVSCKGCGNPDIHGVRYKCIICSDYNLCQSCEARTGLHPETHNFVKIKTSTSTSPPSTSKVTDGFSKISLGADKNVNKKISVNFQNSATDTPYHSNTAASYTGTGCYNCGGDLVGQFTITGNRKWHHQCFVCCVCGTQLREQGHYCKDEKYYCLLDYLDRFAKRCTGCGKVCDKQHATADGVAWHYECFVCCKCGVQLPTYRKKDGKYYCVPHYHEAFSPRCAGCGKVCDQRYTTVKGATWHHECFVCCKCGVQLRTHYNKDGKFYCVSDYQKYFQS